ncbi:YceD family protein [Xanthobacter sp. TB0136]|uniref:YceD family protein n=1 Tax=Xanthobacter sp. TB0136 TaxID=3459177 RepID=UPI004039E2CA
MSDIEPGAPEASSASPLPLSRPVTIAEINPRGLEIDIRVDEPALLQELARYVDVLAVSDFRAQIRLAHEGADGIHVTGTVRATIRQNCGVSLEPFDAPLNEMVDVHFVPAGTAIPSESLEDEDHDLPDEILDGRIDVGALALEFLALGVDPYPRKPDAVFIAPEPEPGALSPFSALARLKD